MQFLASSLVALQLATTSHVGVTTQMEQQWSSFTAPFAQIASLFTQNNAIENTAEKPAEKSAEEKPLVPAYRPKASEVLLMVQAFYDATTDLTAKFKQVYWNQTFHSRTVTSGDLKLMKPGRMLWDYKGRSEHDFYSDGSRIWVIEHDTRQVTWTEMDENSDLSAAMKFLFGGEHLLREFKVRYAKGARLKKYGDAEHHVLELKPKKKKKHYKGLLLVVHATTGRVDGFTVYNNDSSSNSYTLSQIKTNQGLSEKIFEFKVPPGYVKSKG